MKKLKIWTIGYLVLSCTLFALIGIVCWIIGAEISLFFKIIFFLFCGLLYGYFWDGMLFGVFDNPDNEFNEHQTRQTDTQSQQNK